LQYPASGAIRQQADQQILFQLVAHSLSVTPIKQEGFAAAHGNYFIIRNTG
jgi:hypothetical protein